MTDNDIFSSKLSGVSNRVWTNPSDNIEGSYNTDKNVKLGNNVYKYTQHDPEMNRIIDIGNEQIKENQYSFKKRIEPPLQNNGDILYRENPNIEVRYPKDNSVSRDTLLNPQPVVINIYQKNNESVQTGQKQDTLLENYYKQMYNNHDLYTSAPEKQYEVQNSLDRYQEIDNKNYVPLTDEKHDNQWNTLPKTDYYNFSPVDF